jgi:hypothetical protein
MMNEKIKQIYEHFGKENQIEKCREELRELNDELLLYLNYENNRGDVLQEIADVTIMLHQMKMAFRISDVDLNETVHEKVDRTIERIGSGYYKRDRIAYAERCVICKETIVVYRGEEYLCEECKLERGYYENRG